MKKLLDNNNIEYDRLEYLKKKTSTQSAGKIIIHYKN